MIYLYAYTNFKDGLDSLRRVAVIYWSLKEKGIEAEILLNEYRAQLLAREWGLPLGTTIETIKDIDAVATNEDIILIDSPETIEGKVLNYPNKFKKVIYLNNNCKDIEFSGAEILNLFKDGIVAPKLKGDKKINKTILVYGDSDYNKTILKISENFKNQNIDLYWGEYFFIKYENRLAEIFDKIIESEEYYRVISTYKNIITSSIQIAIEAYLNGANVVLLSKYCNNHCLNYFNSKVCDKLFDKLDIINFKNEKKLENINSNYIFNQIFNIIKKNM